LPSVHDLAPAVDRRRGDRGARPSDDRSCRCCNHIDDPDVVPSHEQSSCVPVVDQRSERSARGAAGGRLPTPGEQTAHPSDTGTRSVGCLEAMSAPDGTKTAEELSSNPTEELGEPATPESVPREHLRFLLAALVMAAGALWLLPLGSSLWLDETATFWVVQGGLHETIHRALEFQSGSVPYFLVAWIARVLGGTSEIALRMPSVIAACV